MSFIAKIFGMEPPEMESPPIEDTPSFEDEQREIEQRGLKDTNVVKQQTAINDYKVI